MTYIVDLYDGRSFFIKLEEYEEVFIYPKNDSKLFIVEIRDCRKPHKHVHQRFDNVEKFTIVSEC